jgi:hypothetical protein
MSGGAMPGGVALLAITLEKKKGGVAEPTTPILLLADTAGGVQI